MTRPVYAVFLLFVMSSPLFGQQPFSIIQYINLARYEEENVTLSTNSKNENRIVLMGDSITEGWKIHRPAFFADGQVVCRGIGGQVTHQMLLRFRADVIELKPRIVVILAGINDIARNSGPVAIPDIIANIKTMAELADYHGIKVVVCSVLPAIDFPWSRGLEPAPKVVELNRRIKEFAQVKGFPYVDYYSAMVDQEGGLKVPEFTTAEDLVHPNPAGYEVMERVLLKTLQQVQKQ